jgi:beta-alanine--pyruvate transaminase
MGGVVVRNAIYDAFMRGPERLIELFHGYTYSAHPLACAAGLATLNLYQSEELFERARTIEPVLAEAAIGLKGLPGVVDIRSVGLAVGIDLAPRSDGVGMRAFEIMERAFQNGLMVRGAGNTIILSPPLIISESQIGEIVDGVGRAIRETP